MSEVRRHERQTASGKRTTVRHHTRGGDKGRTRREEEDEAAREAWADRNAPHVSSLTPAEAEPQAQEWWAEDDMPPPGAFWDEDDAGEDGAHLHPDWGKMPDDADEVEHEGHTFKVNRAPAYRPQGDHDFAAAEPQPATRPWKEMSRDERRQALQRYKDARAVIEAGKGLPWWRTGG